MARVLAVLASMTWKSGRRRKRSAARAVVGAARVGGGAATAATGESTEQEARADAKYCYLHKYTQRSAPNSNRSVLVVSLGVAALGPQRLVSLCIRQPRAGILLGRERQVPQPSRATWLVWSDKSGRFRQRGHPCRLQVAVVIAYMYGSAIFFASRRLDQWRFTRALRPRSSSSFWLAPSLFRSAETHGS